MRSRQPQQVRDTDWYYEYPTYCLVVHEVKDKKSGAHIRTDSFQIPWRMLKQSIDRAYKPRKKSHPQ